MHHPNIYHSPYLFVASNADIEQEAWIPRKQPTRRVKESSGVEWLLLVMHAGHANPGYVHHSLWRSSRLNVLLAISFTVRYINEVYSVMELVHDAQYASI
jgi:hypothetical protein